MGSGYGQSSSKPQLSKSEQKKQKKQQAAREKLAKEEEAKARKALERRNKELRKARGARNAVHSKRGGGGGPIGFLFSWKGLLLVALTGFLYVQQRELLMAIVLKYPIALFGFICRTVWQVALKPLVRLIISFRGSNELPLGAY
jgi:hypothetical protein